MTVLILTPDFEEKIKISFSLLVVNWGLFNCVLVIHLFFFLNLCRLSFLRLLLPSLLYTVTMVTGVVLLNLKVRGTGSFHVCTLMVRMSLCSAVVRLTDSPQEVQLPPPNSGCFKQTLGDCRPCSPSITGARAPHYEQHNQSKAQFTYLFTEILFTARGLAWAAKTSNNINAVILP